MSRYKAILVYKDAYLLELCRHIILNPVRAHMVDTPVDSLWSSWHHTVAKQAVPNWLACDAVLSYFANAVLRPYLCISSLSSKA